MASTFLCLSSLDSTLCFGDLTILYHRPVVHLFSFYIVFQCMNITQWICFTDGHLSCFQIGATLKRIAIHFAVTCLLDVFLLGIDLEWTFWIIGYIPCLAAVCCQTGFQRDFPKHIPTSTTT